MAILKDTIDEVDLKDPPHTLYELNSSIWKYADMIGYRYSPNREAFLAEFKSYYSFLYKFINFSRTSKFWYKNSQNLIQAYVDIRKKLNDEIIIRRKAAPLTQLKSPNNISSLAKYAFCPVSFAINLSYEVPKSEEVNKSIELRETSILEKYIEVMTNKRKLGFLFAKMKLKREEVFYPSINEDAKKNEIKLTYYKNRYDESSKIEQILKYDPEEFSKWIDFGDIGSVINSTVLYKRDSNRKAEDYFINKEYNITGSPDFLIRTKKDEVVVLLEKYTWNKEVITNPFPNHIIQAAGYLYFLKEELKADYAYILYMQSIGTFRIFRVNLSDSIINKLNNIHSEIRKFYTERTYEFNIGEINVKKCFRCSARIFCSHKAGKLSKIQLPYRLK